MAANEIIVLVYTGRYLASVPIVVMWSSMALLAPFSVDGVLRVFPQTRILLILYVVRLTGYRRADAVGFGTWVSGGSLVVCWLTPFSRSLVSKESRCSWE